MKRLPPLTSSNRRREYDCYPDNLRDKIVYEYLFLGKSHRKLDEEILGLDSEDSRGWQSMGVLHFLGLRNAYKGYFQGKQISEAIEFLQKEEDEFIEISNILKRYQSNVFNEIDLSLFLVKQSISPLIAKIDLSKLPDRIIVNKEYCSLFNSSDFLQPQGNDAIRKINVMFNNKIFDAEYWIEDKSSGGNELQSIILGKELKTEFEKLFTGLVAEIAIHVGVDHNHYSFNLLSSTLLENEEALAYPEGQVNYKNHRILERNPQVIKKAKELFIKNYGALYCEICGFRFDEHYGERGDFFIEGHHNKLVSQMKPNEKTRVEDISMLCSNCHRMIHRKPLITVEELKKQYI